MDKSAYKLNLRFNKFFTFDSWIIRIKDFVKIIDEVSFDGWSVAIKLLALFGRWFPWFLDLTWFVDEGHQYPSRIDIT